MISQDWCYNKRKVPAGATAPVVWIERQENNMHISY
ncbi:MAG: XRE family transcriptional regulator, partial [Mediterraneibacter gnavus]